MLIQLRYALPLMAVVTASSALACGSPDTRHADAFTASDSAGVQIIVNHSLSRAEPGWILDSLPIVTIGNNSLDSNQQFRRAPSALRLANGNIIIADEGKVSTFDSTGSHLKTLIRRGRGPGELQSVSRMIVLKDDTLVVRGGARIMKFSAAAGGSLVSDERLQCTYAPRFWNANANCFEFHADGSALTIMSDSTIPRTASNRPDVVYPDQSSSPGPGHLRQFYRIFIIPPQADTAYPTGLSAEIEQFGIAVSPGREEFVIHPFYSVPYKAYGGTPRRLAIALNPEYNVEVWSGHGKLERLIRRSSARRTPTEAEKLDARKYIETQLEGSSITVDRALAEITVPDSLPAFAGLTMGPGGELLVQTGGWRSADSATVLDVFDARGFWVAEWKLPRRARVLEMGSDYILTTRLGDDDVPLVELRHFRKR